RPSQRATCCSYLAADRRAKAPAAPKRAFAADLAGKTWSSTGRKTSRPRPATPFPPSPCDGVFRGAGAAAAEQAGPNLRMTWTRCGPRRGDGLERRDAACPGQPTEVALKASTAQDATHSTREAPAAILDKAAKELGLIGLFRRAAHLRVEHVRILADENA